MKILIDDLIQRSNAPDTLKSAALSDIYATNNFVITLDDDYNIDCVGVGYTDANHIIVNGETIHLHLSGTGSKKNGLYLLATKLISENTLTISHDGAYLGRFAAGAYTQLCASPTKELGFYTTSQERVTVGGQVVPGAGGYCGRSVNLDFRYKFNSTILTVIDRVFAAQISLSLPFFVYFDSENFSSLWTRMYASIPNKLMFQTSIRDFLLSHKLELTERF